MFISPQPLKGIKLVYKSIKIFISKPSNSPLGVKGLKRHPGQRCNILPGKFTL
jgi:hypothetical protein